MFKMTHNILRNLVVKKSTRRYPFEVCETFDKVRGELVNDIARCIFCGTCEVKCPSQCIEVDRKAAVWTCDPFACVYCGVCVDTCPAKSLFHGCLPVLGVRFITYRLSVSHSLRFPFFV